MKYKSIISLKGKGYCVQNCCNLLYISPAGFYGKEARETLFAYIESFFSIYEIEFLQTRYFRTLINMILLFQKEQKK